VLLLILVVARDYRSPIVRAIDAGRLMRRCLILTMGVIEAESNPM
jgi:hypothetical protein